MSKPLLFSALDLPEQLLEDDNHAEKIELPAGFEVMPISSAPQYTLYRLLRHLRPAKVLEIGTQSGYSALIMALAFRDNGRRVDITSVDPFCPCGDNNGLATLAEWYTTISKSGFKSDIRLLISPSERILPSLQVELDFVFVDGSHEYEHVRQDCLLALKLLRDGGYFLVHDSTIYESVRKGALEIIRDFQLPYSVNNIQKNDRGDLCGWTIVRKRGGIEASLVDAALAEGVLMLADKAARESAGTSSGPLIHRILGKAKALIRGKELTAEDQ